jgi:AAA ATPase domain
MDDDAVPLYGREREAAQLNELFAAIVSPSKPPPPPHVKQTQCVLVTGSVGMGKHTLVETTLRPAVVSAGGWFLSHRYDSHQQQQRLGPVGETTAEHRRRLLPKRYKFAELDQGIYACIKVSNDNVSLSKALSSAFSTTTADRDTLHEMLPLVTQWLLDQVDNDAAPVFHSDTSATGPSRSTSTNLSTQNEHVSWMARCLVAVSQCVPLILHFGKSFKMPTLRCLTCWKLF